MSARACTALAVVALCSCLVAGCDDQQSDTPTMSGAVNRGVKLIRQNGCGACHQIPGIENANGLVGPPLNAVGRRIYIAGVKRNTPEAMIAWLQNPQAIVPGNAMPNMGLSERDARDIAAYLYTLR
jgi:cytochrome c2